MVGEFAQIVGLLAAFSSGRAASQSAELGEFLEWLSRNNHDEIRKLVEQNQSTATSIKAMLNLGFEDVIFRLDNISAQLALLAHSTPGTEQLAASFTEDLISVQAMRLLALMEEHEAEYFLISKTKSSPDRLILSQGPNFTPDEQRFLHDDLNLLAGLGVLQLDHNSKGAPLYRYTRAASKLFNSK